MIKGKLEMFTILIKGLLLPSNHILFTYFNVLIVLENTIAIKATTINLSRDCGNKPTQFGWSGQVVGQHYNKQTNIILCEKGLKCKISRSSPEVHQLFMLKFLILFPKKDLTNLKYQNARTM